MRRALAGMGAVALVGLVPQSCGGSQDGIGITFNAYLTVAAHPSEQVPHVVGVIRGNVNPPPRGGVLVMVMTYARTVVGPWHFAGRATRGNPWHTGPLTLGPIRYPCLRSGLRWRLRISFDGIAPDGSPYKGLWWYPSRFGKKLTC